MGILVYWFVVDLSKICKYSSQSLSADLEEWIKWLKPNMLHARACLRLIPKKEEAKIGYYYFFYSLFL